MQILPAIDIKEGQAVRLFKGDFNQKTVVNPDVIGQSKIFAQAGIDFIHVVDLDGALDGRATNRDLIAKLKKNLDLVWKLVAAFARLNRLKIILR